MGTSAVKVSIRCLQFADKSVKILKVWVCNTFYPTLQDGEWNAPLEGGHVCKYDDIVC